MKVKVLILTGYGINAEKELKWGFDIAGGNAEIIHIEDIINKKKKIFDYQILAFPGGFSYGDHIASGRVFGARIKYTLFEEIKRFIEDKRLIIGICNGFQIITKMGLVPDCEDNFEQEASLIENDSGHFEDRWVWLKKGNSNSFWLKDIDRIYVPVRHGEGKFITKDENILNKIIKNGQIAFQYVNPNKDTDEVEYPFNPNGSVLNIAGITNKEGNILGLMPHPEAFIFEENHPNWTEGKKEKFLGLKILKNGIDYFK
ncbi:MAG TPA: phosphoribosylformylglycinamidine synthase I [Spirochaetota bacterium]|nr:phosphoribosylformylglycinamidine synthase I [Spirochaetota bacterium]HOL56812.1 phosphoribosylformylglycinamidine synthase I [Spirochaetota bacterium]HPP04240.1 phosphoribosylformylglycinamidine synthase I [Spirochaetota bacterium]